MNRQPDLTFKHNLKNGRHGWLRLTPAYSIKVVEQLLDQVPDVTHVLDPFSGSGTTGLVSAERGIHSTLIEINPFLVWLAEVKTANYPSTDLLKALSIATEISHRVESQQNGHYWTPPISNIDRWWSSESLQLLGGIHGELDKLDPSPVKNLLLVAFCRLVIETSNAAFNHQSMSFKDTPARQLSFEEMRSQRFLELVEEIARSAEYPLATPVEIICADSRQIPTPTTRYDCVITSPPYPNRMSYIRELRPYMYWLGFLNEAREAGELDWQAIGGTWGIATSRLQQWQADEIQIPSFQTMLQQIRQNSPLLANYVHRYFVDIVTHLTNLKLTLADGARLFYVIGNAKFYDTLVPSEQIYAHLLAELGFVDIGIEKLRKRNSKKELFEYVVSATVSYPATRGSREKFEAALQQVADVEPLEEDRP